MLFLDRKHLLAGNSRFRAVRQGKLQEALMSL